MDKLKYSKKLTDALNKYNKKYYDAKTALITYRANQIIDYDKLINDALGVTGDDKLDFEKAVELLVANHIIYFDYQKAIRDPNLPHWVRKSKSFGKKDLLVNNDLHRVLPNELEVLAYNEGFYITNTYDNKIFFGEELNFYLGSPSKTIYSEDFFVEKIQDLDERLELLFDKYVNYMVNEFHNLELVIDKDLVRGKEISSDQLFESKSSIYKEILEFLKSYSFADNSTKLLDYKEELFNAVKKHQDLLSSIHEKVANDLYFESDSILYKVADRLKSEFSTIEELAQGVWSEQADEVFGDYDENMDLHDFLMNVCYNDEYLFDDLVSYGLRDIGYAQVSSGYILGINDEEFASELEFIEGYDVADSLRLAKALGYRTSLYNEYFEIVPEDNYYEIISYIYIDIVKGEEKFVYDASKEEISNVIDEIQILIADIEKLNTKFEELNNDLQNAVDVISNF